MNIHELDSYNLGDAVKFHRRLNPRIWGRDEHLLPEVREKLLTIAEDFQEFLGVEDLNVQDITISGSNAAYSYTKNSDIDLHLVVKMPDNPVYQELFNAKKYQYNSEHNIKIGGADVELYVQPSDQAHHSQGIYSIKDSKWQQIPQRKRAQVDDTCVRDKVADLDSRIHTAVKSKNLEAISTLWDKIKAMRQSGLEQQGEFGCENIAFKMLRNSGCIKLLKDAMTAQKDRELSLREADQPQQRFRYGFSEGHQGQPYSSEDGVAASTKQFLEDSNSETNLVQEFIQHTAMELGIDPLPEIHLHTDPEWSTNNQSFGRYDPHSHTLNVSMPNRHILDVLRTVAHELVHCSQNQQHNGLPDDAGETGSRWENDANARAGIIMRDWANSHPEHFELPALEESASGYIPKNKKEAAMPQYAMALSVDIKPGQVGKEANKLALKTGRNGEPGLLMPDAQNLLREFAEFAEEQDNLFEISMSPSSLKKLSAQTGALAGMEFEMIVPGIGDDDGDQEPDYDFDQRCRSIQDARDFFYDGDYNGRQDIERMSDRMQNDYAEWLYERIDRDFVNESEYLISEWVANNVDESEWNPDELEGEARQEALDEFISNVDADPSSDYYQKALDDYREENQDSYDESDWLDAEDLDLMSYVENAYDVTWPHWRSTGGGEVSINDVADSFQAAIGRDVKASSSYHSGRVERPSTRSLHYIVEPDSSLDPDNSDDQGLEFVSPPLPIEELLSDLNKVKAWADRTGCYTNDSTGLHINVSVPGWTTGTDQLDYVKLALLLGDEFVLDSFGRAGNTYAKSAMGKIVDIVRQRPDRAQLLMNRMKQGLDQLATRLVHGRQTEKYTSINVKDGYIEFRSPGGDWLNDKFPEIENTLRRFTVALSAAVDPEAYRKEYLKKLYKLLNVNGEKDPLSYFAKYAAGELPRAALKSFVRQAQLQRGVKRGEETGPMWWRVYKEGKNASNGAVIEVVASSKEEALDKAAKEWGVFSDEYRRAMYAEPVRPYKQETKGPELNGRPTNPDGNYVIVNAATQEPAYRYMASDMTDAILVLRQWITANPGTQWDFKRDPEMRLGQPGQQQPQGVDTRVDYELYSRASGAVIDTFPARNDDEAQIRLDDYREHGAGQSSPDNFDVRRAGRPAATAPAAYAEQYYDVEYTADDGTEGMARVRAPNATAAMDRIRSQSPNITDIEANLSRYQDAPGSTTDLQRQRAAAAAQQQPSAPPPAGGEFTGNWLIRAEDGTVLHRFGGIGNSQADANRTALAWAQRNPDVIRRYNSGLDVVPEMMESLTESNQLRLKDFVVTISPHALDQAHAKGVDVHMVDDILRNISKVKDNIMSLEPGRALILHNGQGTGLGVRRGQGNNLTLATVFPTNPGFRKGKHPTFQVEANEVDEGVRSALATAALAGTMAMGAQAKAPNMVQQIVEPGDTIYSIARQNNVNPLEIYRLNKMDRNTRLEVGQQVVVPDYSKPVSKMPATVAPTVKQPPPAAQPAPTLKDKISSMLPKFPDDDEGVTLLSDNPDAEAALQTAAKAAGLKGSELAQFMAQTRHESWDFGKMKEVGNKKTFAKYEKPRLAKQLGNKVKGDGERFKGRGFIQLTGRDNYTRASQQIFGDDRLVKNPDLATRLDVGAQIALWFWKNQVRPAVKDFNNTTQVVKAINADEPAKVVQQRHTKFKEYLAVL